MGCAMRAGVIVFVAATSLLAACGVSQAINWETDLDASLKKASAAGMPVMADFYTDWCGWCKKLDKDVYTDREVDRLSGSFVCVKVNCGTDRKALSAYNLKGFPTVIFFDSAGGPAETIIGYRPAANFIVVMNNVLNRTAGIPAAEKPKPAFETKLKVLGEGEFELQGLMMPKAIVNDKIVVVGQTVNGAKVVKITDSGVKLLFKGEEIVLGMVSVGIEKDADGVYLKNGRKLKGIVLREGAKTISLQTEGGTMEISRQSVKKIQYATDEALARLREKWKIR